MWKQLGTERPRKNLRVRRTWTVRRSSRFEKAFGAKLLTIRSSTYMNNPG